MVNPYLDEKVKDYFYQFTWDELNKPRYDKTYSEVHGVDVQKVDNTKPRYPQGMIDTI